MLLIRPAVMTDNVEHCDFEGTLHILQESFVLEAVPLYRRSEEQDTSGYLDFNCASEFQSDDFVPLEHKRFNTVGTQLRLQDQQQQQFLYFEPDDKFPHSEVSPQLLLGTPIESPTSAPVNVAELILPLQHNSLSILIPTSQHTEHSQYLQHPQHHELQPHHVQLPLQLPQAPQAPQASQTSSFPQLKSSQKSKAKARSRSAPILTGLSTQRGLIPATRPKLTCDPLTGEHLLSFSYSRKKVATMFQIKSPELSMDTTQFPLEFQEENCVYPRAIAPPSEYTGKRGKYERECNSIGWTLAWMNPHIRGNRGLIQRAVDSWRNTRDDRALHSRKVRRDEISSTSGSESSR